MDPNIQILESLQEEIDRIARERGLQAAIDHANAQIDPSIGIVAGDGSYYPRRVNGRDPFTN